MASQTTLAVARDKLYKNILPGDDAFAESVKSAINDACQRLIESGKWAGTMGNVDFASVPTGYITLPRHYGAILASRIKDHPVRIEGKYYEYQATGPGKLSTDSGVGFLIDCGFSPLETEITDAGTLRFLLNAADVDATKNIRIYGLDADGNVITDTNGVEGVNVTMSAVTINSSHTFSKVTNIVKPTTKYPVIAQVVVATVPTQIAEWEPLETIPQFRRYKVGEIEADEAHPFVIETLCKRRFIAAEQETDFVIPGNLQALKMAVLALKYEDENDLKAANDYWGMAYGILNGEMKEDRGGSKINVQFVFNGGLRKTRSFR
jgi:hypothetical protein